MQRKTIAEVFCDPEEDVFGYTYPKIADMEIDDMYSVQSEVMSLLIDVFDIIGDKRNEKSRTVIKS